MKRTKRLVSLGLAVVFLAGTILLPAHAQQTIQCKSEIYYFPDSSCSSGIGVCYWYWCEDGWNDLICDCYNRTQVFYAMNRTEGSDQE